MRMAESVEVLRIVRTGLNLCPRTLFERPLDAAPVGISDRGAKCGPRNPSLRSIQGSGRISGWFAQLMH